MTVARSKVLLLMQQTLKTASNPTVAKRWAKLLTPLNVAVDDTPAALEAGFRTAPAATHRGANA